MSRKKLYLLLALLVLLTVSVLIYFFVFKEVVFVTDVSWDLLEPDSEMRSLHFNLALRGRRLKCIDFEEFFSSYDRHKNSSLVVLSPLSSAAAVSRGMAFSTLFDCVVAGLACEEDYEVFDIVLKSYTEEISEDAVDYRFSAYAEGKKIYCPSLSASILPLLNSNKEDIHGTGGILIYGYR